MTNYVDKYHQLKDVLKSLSTDSPGMMKGFHQLHSASMEAKSVSTKTKELIALGIAIAVRCDGCIAYHVHDAIKAGCGKEEILEAIDVAVMMGGGPALMYGAEAYTAYTQFEEDTEDYKDDMY